tara:strand:+ start:123 stop:443 length:321 start_codon:yes stop_codon:yes gene_type:complete
MSKRGKNRKQQQVVKLQFQDLVFSQHAEDRLNERVREFQFNGHNVRCAMEEQFSYFKTGQFNCRIKEVAVQAAKYIGQRIMYNERLNMMLAVESNGTVCTVMSIKK